jgi:hypothetical protein
MKRRKRKKRSVICENDENNRLSASMAKEEKQIEEK